MLTLRAEVAAARSDLAGLRDLLARAVAQPDSWGYPFYALGLLGSSARVEADAAVVARAVRDRSALQDCRHDPALLRATAASFDRYASPVLDAMREDLRAELARADGGNDPDLWRAAVTAWGPLQHPYERAWSLLRLAEACVQTGRDEALDALRAADTAAGGPGAEPLASEIAALASRARFDLGGSRRPASALSDPAVTLGLTSRERDVLALLAEGYTNAEIAARLFISPKTASVHVSRILTKLGATTRTRAAAIALRLDLNSGT